MTLTTGRWTEEQIAEIRKRTGGSARTIGLAVPQPLVRQTAYQQPPKGDSPRSPHTVTPSQRTGGCAAPCESDGRAWK